LSAKACEPLRPFLEDYELIALDLARRGRARTVTGAVAGGNVARLGSHYVFGWRAPAHACSHLARAS
jgi:hypothetical protein